jgi:hypothetical protein
MQTMTVSLGALVVLQLTTAAPADDKSSFITTLGRDTVVVESVVLANGRVTGDIIVRVPSTVRLHYDVGLKADGSVARATLDQDPMGAKDIPKKHVVIQFGPDSLRVTIDSDGQTTKAARALEAGTAPTLMTGFDASYGLYSSMGLYELALARIKRTVNDTVNIPGVDLITGHVLRRQFLARSATAIDVDYFGVLWTHLAVDASGRITAADARSTTEKTLTQRTAYTDAAAIAKSWAAMDAAGKGVGMASPNLIAKGMIGGQTVTVTYGSPRRRGRTILGNVIVYDRVWRTGANAATVITFDKPMTIGDSTLAVGAYSLYSVPKADGTVQLIINSQHGQWGTDYDPTKNIALVPMQVSPAPAPLEDFTISIVGSGSRGELHMAWDTFVWSVPLSVKQ